MSKKIDLQGSCVVEKAKIVTKICSPLTDIYNINYFRYMKLFNNGDRFILCNMPDVMRFFYEEGRYPLAWHDQAKPASAHDAGFTLWAIKRLSDSNDQKTIEKEMAHIFNIKQGLACVIKGIKSVEIFDFGSPQFDIYDINVNLFKRFIFYFKEQARKLIEYAQYEKIHVPMSDDSIVNTEILNKENQFLESIKTKRYYLSGLLEGSYLTDRELDCLNWCCKGKTAEEIAYLLNISKKTVEHHLDSIRRKLNCYKQSQLIRAAIKLGLIDN